MDTRTRNHIAYYKAVRRIKKHPSVVGFGLKDRLGQWVAPVGPDRRPITNFESVEEAREVANLLGASHYFVAEAPSGKYLGENLSGWVEPGSAEDGSPAYAAIFGEPGDVAHWQNYQSTSW